MPPNSRDILPRWYKRMQEGYTMPCERVEKSRKHVIMLLVVIITLSERG